MPADQANLHSSKSEHTTVSDKLTAAVDILDGKDAIKAIGALCREATNHLTNTADSHLPTMDFSENPNENPTSIATENLSQAAKSAIQDKAKTQTLAQMTPEQRNTLQKDTAVYDAAVRQCEIAPVMGKQWPTMPADMISFDKKVHQTSENIFNNAVSSVSQGMSSGETQQLVKDSENYDRAESKYFAELPPPYFIGIIKSPAHPELPQSVRNYVDKVAKAAGVFTP